ncbi:MAG: hypothetical protein ACXWC2_07230 [Ramlibacter sp.]
MRAALLACLAAVAGATAAQGQGDPLKSQACGQHLAALQAARSPGSGKSPADIEALRRDATQACLGGNGAARRPAPSARAPDIVPPPMVALPRSTPPTVLPLPAPPIQRPPVLTSCDAAGCWDSNGTRLDRAGPLLIGPGGACVRTGLQVQCP